MDLPEQVRTVALSDGVLQALSVPPRPAVGLSQVDQVSRGPDPGAFFSGRSTTVMLSYGHWQRRFGGDTSVIGCNITVDSHSREVVGVNRNP